MAKIKKVHVTDAWVTLRKHNCDIPDDVLDKMKEVLLEHVKMDNSSVLTSLPVEESFKVTLTYSFLRECVHEGIIAPVQMGAISKYYNRKVDEKYKQ